MTEWDWVKSGWSVERLIEKTEFGENEGPEDMIWYVTYSDVYHTNYKCPYIQHSENLFMAGGLSSLSMAREPGLKGPRDVFTDIRECNWCKNNENK